MGIPFTKITLPSSDLTGHGRTTSTSQIFPLNVKMTSGSNGHRVILSGKLKAEVSTWKWWGGGGRGVYPAMANKKFF